ncbi:MAG: hypothetical protein Q7S79_00635 [bacterium]|nr:hypothetical protein [bacterium]
MAETKIAPNREETAEDNPDIVLPEGSFITPKSPTLRPGRTLRTIGANEVPAEPKRKIDGTMNTLYRAVDTTEVETVTTHTRQTLLGGTLFYAKPDAGNHAKPRLTSLNIRAKAYWETDRDK